MSDTLQDPNSRDENGKYHINFRNELDAPLTHGEMDFNLSILGETIQGYRVMGTSADGSIDLNNDLDKTIKLHKITIDDTALITAGAQLDEYIWLTSNAGSGGVGIGGTVTSHLIPDADVTYDLGSPTNKFRDLYLSNNTIYLGDDVISTTGGNIKVNNVELVKADTFINDATASAENLGIETQLRTEAIADINLSLTSLTNSNEALSQAVTDLDTSFTAELTNSITGETLARTEAVSGINETLTSLSTANEAIAQSVTNLDSKFINELNSSITGEQLARTEALAGIEETLTTITSGDQAVAQSVTDLNTKFTNELNSSITGEQLARTEALAGIEETLTTITNADYASASSVTELGTQFTTQLNNETNTRTEAIAGVKSQIDAVSNDTSAAATKVDTLESSFTTQLDGAISVEKSERELAILAETNARISEIQDVVGSIPSEFNTDGLATTEDLQGESNNRVSEIAAEAAERARVLGIETTARVESNSSIETRLTTLNTANLSAADSISGLSTSFTSELNDTVSDQNLLRTEAMASVEQRLTALSTADGSTLLKVDKLGTDFSIEIAAAVSDEGDIRAAAITDVTSQIVAISNADGANVTRLDTLEAQYTLEGGDITGIRESSALKTTIESAIATENQATINSTTSLIAQLDRQTAGVLETQTANIDALTGKVEAQYTLEVNADGNVAGMKLGADENGSSIAFTADSFKVSSGNANGDLLTPFSIVDGQVAFNGAVSFTSGPAGPTGADGVDGTDGTDGTDGQDGAQGAAGIKGADGQSAYNAWLAADNQGTVADFLNSLIGAEGLAGSQGVAGPKGPDGDTTYTWIKYADSIDGEGINNAPGTRPYIGFAYNKKTKIESNVPSDYTWSLIKGADGQDGAQGAAGFIPVKGVHYFDGEPGRDGSDGDSAYAAWLANDNIGTGTDFLNSLIGQDGVQGSDGVAGEDGKDGERQYTWIKYADNGDGSSGFSNSPVDKKYIGFAFNKNTNVESTTASDYTWSLIKGSDGTDGADGNDGATGPQGANGADGADGDTVITESTIINGGSITTGILINSSFQYPGTNLSNNLTAQEKAEALTSADWDSYTTSGMGINLDKGAINAENFYIDQGGNASFKGDLDLAGNVTAGGGVMADFFGISDTTGDSFGKLVMKDGAYMGGVLLSDFKDNVEYKDGGGRDGFVSGTTLSHTHVKRNDVLIEVGDLVKLDYNNELIKASSSKDTGIAGILWEEIDYSIKPSIADKFVTTPRVFIEKDHHYRDSFGNKLQEADRDSKSLWRVAAIGDSVEKDLLGMKVCNQNGPVLTGDLVCSSDTPGYVMKQPVEYVITDIVDGIPQYELRQAMAPFTVGKCMQDCKFDSNGKAEEIYGYLYCG